MELRKGTLNARRLADEEDNYLVDIIFYNKIPTK
jgi:hypothetical protein